MHFPVIICLIRYYFTFYPHQLTLRCRKRAESDDTVPDAPARAEKFAQRYFKYSLNSILFITVQNYPFC